MKKDSHISNSSILESISDGVFTVDESWKITYFNKAAEEITGVKKDQAIGKMCCDVFRSSMCESRCALRETLKTGEPVIDRACFIVNAGGEKIPITISTAVLYDEKGNVIGGAETFRDISEVEALKKELSGRILTGDLKSFSLEMQKVNEMIKAVSKSSSPVLICGETGTGKEVAARAIHSQGPEDDRQFVAVNCGAFPDTLLESELFGYKKGAFTGADKDKKGWLSVAKGGTLLLDEIGEISKALQVKLLRVLQEYSFQPLGSTETEKLDARLIFATNRDLKKMVEEGTFRQDLFYRINVIEIEIPPLRKRLADIPFLVESFIEKFNFRQKKNIKKISRSALSVLSAYDFPGNIRELENIIERAFILCDSDIIGLEHLPQELAGMAPQIKPSGSIKDMRKDAEKKLIIEALKRNNFNKAATARDLKIHKATLFRKIKSLGIKG